jgi:hypothetical protein
MAIATEIESDEGKSIPEVKILECYGSLVHTIFSF